LKKQGFTLEETIRHQGEKFSQSDKNFNSGWAVCHSPLVVPWGDLSINSY
jgi:hypothetical protein